jgi:acetyltransferase EpsM|tara:strand:- start:5468 stop:6145 length:678 start_codon:yes stop_codon:yes gene_type:complete
MLKRKNKKKILIYGGKSTAYIVYDMLKESKLNPSYIFDEYLKKPSFISRAIFSNKKNDLKKFIHDSDKFFVCIGMMDGKLRDYISTFFIKKKLVPFSVISKNSIIDKSVIHGHGLLAMPNSVVHKYCRLGNNCYLNVNSVVDHECIIGNGVHIMGSAYIAGRVKIENYVSVGANATILPDLTLGEGSIIGAGAVVTKNVKPNEVVVGNPAKFLKKNKKKYNLKIL